MQNAVAPNVLPAANSQIPAIVCAMPPVATAGAMMKLGWLIPRAPTLNMERMKVVAAKAASPRGAGEPSFRW